MKITDENDERVEAILLEISEVKCADDEVQLSQQCFKKKSHSLLTINSLILALIFNLSFVFTMNLALVSIETNKAVHAKAKTIQSYLYISRKKAAPIESPDTLEAITQMDANTSPLVFSYEDKTSAVSKVISHRSDNTKKDKTDDSVRGKIQKQQTIQSRINIKDITRSYLSRQKAVAIDSSAIAYANVQTNFGTLSEMTPSVKPLWTPEGEKEEDKKIIQHKLDPNRIVKEGHICKRVIQVGDPLSPHAEILGYEFKCGLTDMEKAYNQAMLNRLKKR